MGDFVSYNDSNGNAIKRNGIALVNTYGTLDTSFDPGSGVAGGFDSTGPFIQTVVLTTNNQYIIGGDFVSYIEPAGNGIAMVNTNGALNTSFLNGLTGVDGTVWAVAVQPDGKILIGGEFGQINGTPCNYIARLKTNGVVRQFQPIGHFHRASPCAGVANGRPDCGRRRICGQRPALFGDCPADYEWFAGHLVQSRQRRGQHG